MEESEKEFIERLKIMKEEGLRRTEEKKKSKSIELKRLREKRKEQNMSEPCKEKQEIEELRKQLNEELRKVKEERRLLEEERKELKFIAETSEKNIDKQSGSSKCLEKTTGSPATFKTLHDQENSRSITKPKKHTKRNRKSVVLNTKEAEERRRKTRERVRAYRQRIRNNPEKYLQSRLEEKLRSSRRRKEGKIKSISNMTKREARVQRKIWREKKQKERRLQKQDMIIPEDSPPPSPSTPERLISSNKPNSSLNKKLSRTKMLRKRRDAEKKRLSDLEQKYKKRNRDAEKWKKRFYREKDKQLSPSPRKMVRQILNKGTSEIRRTLLFNCAVTKQLRKNRAKLKNKDEKNFLAKCVSGDIIKKAKMMKKMENLKLSSVYLQRKYAVNKGSLNKKIRVGKIRKIKSKVIEFFQDDENSIQTPGKRQYITRKKVKKQKRLLLDSVKELHKRFIKTTNIKISYTSFNKLKPFWVVAPKESDRDTCKCIRHANFELMLKPLKRNNIIKLKHTNEVLETINCNVSKFECMYGKCRKCETKEIKQADKMPYNPEDDICFYEWVRQKVEVKKKYTKSENPNDQFENGKKQQVKIVTIVKKEKRKCTVGELINKFNDYLKTFCIHVYNANHQRTFLKLYKEQLKANEMIIVLDWSENYACRYSEEIQSMHFGGSRQQISLHTGVLYFQEETLEAKSFCTISSSRHHGPTAIWAHMKPILEFIKENYCSVDTLHFFSDGPTAQYRNKENFFLMAKIAADFNMWKVSWNFSEAGHGKGPADAIGGIIKRTADAKLLHQNDVVDVPSFKNAIADLKVISFIIEEADILEMKQSLPAKLDAIPRTMKLHQLTWTKLNPQVLGTRILSCQHCSGSTKCKHFPLDSGEFNLAYSVTKQPSSDMNAAVPSQLQELTQNIKRDDAGNSCEESVIPMPKSNNVTVGSWVAVIYDQIWYPGIVEKAEGNILTVKFMVRSKNFFQWPSIEDRQTLHVEGVLCNLKPPTKISSRLFKFDDCEEIDEQCSIYID